MQSVYSASLGYFLGIRPKIDFEFIYSVCKTDVNGLEPALQIDNLPHKLEILFKQLVWKSVLHLYEGLSVYNAFNFSW